MKTNSIRSWLFNKGEERFAENLRSTLACEYPNPTRAGCPDSQTIRDLAFHKRIGNAELFEQITNHIAECSNCTRDTLGYVEEYRKVSKRRHTVSLAIALAATIALAVAVWAIWQSRQQEPPTIVKSSMDATQPQPAPLLAHTGDLNKNPEITKVQRLVIDLPMTWRGTAATVRPIILPRGHLQLEIRLPIGSPAGAYKVCIYNPSGVQKSFKKNALTSSGVISLSIDLDSSAMSPGEYTFSVWEPDTEEGTEYHLIVK